MLSSIFLSGTASPEDGFMTNSPLQQRAQLEPIVPSDWHGKRERERSLLPEVSAGSSGVSALSQPGASSWTRRSALESVAMHGS